MKLTCTLLGTGSSGGVPRIGNDWGACDPDDPLNRRSRCSAHVSVEASDGKTVSILIDTAPEMREQLLRCNINRVDAVLYTHAHADQAHGIDDLRVLVYEQKKRMPIYGDEFTLNDLIDRFRYCFHQPENSSYPPILNARPFITPFCEFYIEEGAFPVRILPLDQAHGSIRSLGFRIGNFAYCNDVQSIPERSLSLLEGVELLVVDALRYKPHPSHAHLDQALQWIERLNPKSAILTNLHIDMDHATVSRQIPDNVVVGFDGISDSISHNINYANS